MTHKRISRANWLEKALEILERDGIDEVKINRLAKELKVSRSGFYWHFESRQALVNAMVELWGTEFTTVVTSNKKLLNLKPKKRLYKTVKMIIENNLTRLELPMLACAETDLVANKLVNRVYRMRLDFIRSAFSEMGFEGEDLEMRTHLFVCYHTWEGNMFRNLSKARRLRWLKLRLEILCAPTDKSS